MKYANAKYFMEYEYRQSHVIQKTEYINEFYVTMENNPKVVEDFDEEQEIDKFILDFIKEKEKSKDVGAGSQDNEQQSDVVRSGKKPANAKKTNA